MHPHLLYQLATARNDEIRQRAARVSATRSARSAAPRRSRWVRRTGVPPTGPRLEREPAVIAIPSSQPRTTPNTLSAER